MFVDPDLLDMQRRALGRLVVENQLPTAIEREDLEGLYELLHAIEDERLGTLQEKVILEFEETT